MVDNITIVAIIAPPYSQNSFDPFEWNGIWFNPEFVKGKRGILKGFVSEYEGLRVFINYDKVFISNSLHKFYKQNNYSDFSRLELIKAIDILCNKMKIEAKNWEIKKLEFGFNIKMPKPANEYLEYFISYKSKEFNKMMHRHICYGRKCFMSEYGIKIYDKAFQTKAKDKVEIDNNSLRIELYYNQKRKLPKNIKNLQDLKNPNLIKLLYNDLIETLRKTSIGKVLDFNNSSSEERILFFAATHPNFIKVEEKLNKSNVKEIKRNISQVKERFLKEDFKEWLLKALSDKYILLFCS